MAMADALGDVPVDPDAQATVTDFLDYTEYLPSDLIRSLTLIRKLDQSYLNSTSAVHNLTKVYGSLPNIPTDERPDPVSLRSKISHNLDHAISARESSYAEASRLYDVVDRHYNRLTSIISKLQSLPKPPSRDPTPAAQPSSPQQNRSRGGYANAGAATTPPPRITLRLDGARAAAAAAAARPPSTAPRARNRGRKVTVPGDVLPPPNPDSPPPSTVSDWESLPPSPVPVATTRVGAPSRSRSSRPGQVKPPKPPKLPKIKLPKIPRGPRPPGVMGTNVHSAVAGISTSNALSLLEPPPPDAKPGSEHAPWMRLTEWEMAKLRKRMKKNAVWSPSETMIRRELADRGRGPENYRATKLRAEANNEEFIDYDKIATTAPGKILAPGEISADSLGMEESQLSNRGMKLNEAKKLKKENLAREQAAQAAIEAEQAATRLGAVGSVISNLFSPRTDDVGESVVVNAAKGKGRDVAKSTTAKRKRDTTPKQEDNQAEPPEPIEPPISPTKRSPKKRKLPTPAPVPILATSTTTIPLAAAGRSSSRASTPTMPSPTETKKPANPTIITTTTTMTRPRSRRSSVAIAAPTVNKPSSPTTSRPPSRNQRSSVPRSASKPSAEPQPTTATAARDRARRASTTSVRTARDPTPARVPAPRRSKRPAPGPVTSSQDGGAAVSVGRRKAAPRKLGGRKVTPAATTTTTATRTAREEDVEVEDEGEEMEMEVDPDEPRYCLCGDVSFGNMVCCENSDVRPSSPLPLLLLPSRRAVFLSFFLPAPPSSSFALGHLLACSSLSSSSS